MKKLFFILFLLGLVSCTGSSKEQLSERLEEEFKWYLTPGTESEKEDAMKNPGEWVRIADERKLGSQLNAWGIREDGVFTIVRLICYDAQEKKFLCEERVASFEGLDKIWVSWIIPISSLAFIFFIWTFLGRALSDDSNDDRPIIIITTIACVVVVMIAWYYNWVMMWSEIIIIMSVILAYTIPYLLDILKKKKRIKK